MSLRRGERRVKLGHFLWPIFVLLGFSLLATSWIGSHCHLKAVQLWEGGVQAQFLVEIFSYPQRHPHSWHCYVLDIPITEWWSLSCIDMAQHGV